MTDTSAKAQRRGRRGLAMRAQVAAALVLLATVFLYTQGVGSARAHAGWRTAGGSFGAPRLPYDLIIGLTHHKTGTSQMGCLLYNFAYALNISTPVYQDNFVTAGNVAVHLAKTTGEPGPRAFLTGHELMKSCYYRNATEHWVVCPNQFPCKDARPVLAMTTCYLNLPVANQALLHFVRDPVELVLSAYLYHMQQPPPEGWIEAMKVPTYIPFLERRGVPLHRLAALGMAPDASPTLSYGGLLRSLTPERGVHLEFWRTVPMMYGMAHQYEMLRSHPSALQVRFEDMRHRFNATLRGIVERLYAPHDPEALLAAAHKAQCDPATWNATELLEHKHVTHGKDAGQKKLMRASLLRDKSIRRHLCTLQGVLEYPLAPECSEDEGGGAEAGPAVGGATQEASGAAAAQQQQQQQQGGASARRRTLDLPALDV